MGRCIDDIFAARASNVTNMLPVRPPFYFSTIAPHAVLVTLYTIVIGIVLLGNVAILATVPWKSHLRTPMNLLFLNLSACHLVGAVALLPYVVIFDIENIGSEKLRNLACNFREKLFTFIVTSSIYAFTLSAISYNRLVIVCFPVKKQLRMSKRVVKLFVVILWVFFICAFIPYFASVEYYPETKICQSNWTKLNLDNGSIYYASMVFYGIIGPVFWLILSYVAIYRRLAQSTRSLSEEVQGTRLRLQVKAVRTLKRLTASFIICWLPIICYTAVFAARSTTDCQQTIEDDKLFRIFVLLATVNGAIDPLVYIFGSSEIRREVRKRMRWAWCGKTEKRTLRHSPTGVETKVQEVSLVKESWAKESWAVENGNT